MTKKVLVVSFSFEQEPEALQVLKDGGLEPYVWKEEDRKGAKEENLIALWNGMKEKPVGLLIGADLQVNREVVEQCEGLKAVSLNCAGYDHLDRKALDEKGVRYCNVPRQNFSAVADLAWGLLIAVMRRIPFAERNIRVIAGILLRVIFCALYQQEHIGEEGDQKDKTFKPADRSDRLTVRSMQDQTAAEKQNQHGHNYREGEIPLYDLRCDRYRGKDRAGSQNTEQVEKI